MSNGCFDLNKRVIDLIMERAGVRYAVAQKQTNRKQKWTKNNLDKVIEAQAKKEDNYNAWEMTQLKAYFQLKRMNKMKLLSLQKKYQ